MDSDATKRTQQHDSVIPSRMHVKGESPLEQRKRFLWCFGIFEIILGIICCVAGGVVMVYLQQIYYSRLGPHLQGVLSICGGVSMILGGIIGLVTGLKPIRCVYIANLVASILNALLLLPVIVLSCFAVYTSFYDPVFICYVLVTISSALGQIIAIVHFTCSGVGLSCCVTKCSEIPVYTQVPLQQMSPDN